MCFCEILYSSDNQEEKIRALIFSKRRDFLMRIRYSYFLNRHSKINEEAMKFFIDL